MKRLFYFSAALLILHTGCRVGPKYEPPCTTVPDNWKGEHAAAEDAIKNNPSLEVAIQRVFEARAMAAVNESALSPKISLNPSYTNTMQLFKIFLPGNVIPGFSGIKPFRIHQLFYILPLSMSYEADLWGRLQSQYESAVYTAQASLFDYQNSLLTLTTDLASNYFQLRALDTQIQILSDTLDQRSKELHLTQSRFEKGIVTYQDVTSSEVQFANAEQQLLDSQRQRVILENMIGTLIGEFASSFTLPSIPLVEDPPVIPPGLPADILLQRPDLAEAERNIASEQVLIGAAEAAFYPTLVLTGNVGYDSPTLEDFLKWRSRYLHGEAASSESLFDGGFNCGKLNAAWARFRQASANYQQQVLTAFQEVEDSLTNIDYQAQEAKSLGRAVRAARTTANLSIARYTKGVTNYLEVIVNDTLALQAEISLSTNLSLRYVATIQLIKAIGGGWKQSDESCR